ncbi:MAG: c-type cytochrome [Deinococcus sp.]|nr:c-type cytochrome [Deinococcus sp.]
MKRWDLAGGLGRRVRGPLTFTLLGLAVIWVLLPLLPAGSGLHFGSQYRVFFSIVVASAGLFFALLNLGPLPQPRSQWGVLGSIALVYLATVGVLVAIGVLYPQFEVPRPTEEAAGVTAEERGQALFLSPEVGCFACHSITAIGVRGGQRAPDLSGVGSRAAARVPGESAEGYIGEHIKRGSDQNYFVVPGFAPIMPPFGQRLSQGQLADLVAFLKGLTGE